MEIILWVLVGSLYCGVGLYTVMADKETLDENSIVSWKEESDWREKILHCRAIVLHPVSSIEGKRENAFFGDSALSSWLLAFFFWPIRIIVVPIATVILFLVIGWCSYFLAIGMDLFRLFCIVFRAPSKIRR